jgi:hypothetical protein
MALQLRGLGLTVLRIAAIRNMIALRPSRLIQERPS